MMDGNRPSSKKRDRLFLIAGAATVVAIIILVAVLIGHYRASVRSEREVLKKESAAGPRVRIVSATLGPDVRTVTLIGEARPYATVTLYAKLSGYLREIRVDKGDRITSGLVLAVIESPELDRQYDAAAADAKIKRADAERAKRLLPYNAISRQTADDAEAAAQVSEATAASLEAQKRYEILSAPFSGTVTARFVDPGMLLQAATTSQTTVQPLLTVSQTDRLRIYTYVDQRNASFVRMGNRAEISDRARPEVKLPATVSRTSGQLDLNTRTLLTELDLDNRLGKILPGSFVQVSLSLRVPSYVEIPVDALRMKEDKAFVGVVSADHRVSFRPITIAESNGTIVRISAGVHAGEKVILHPGESLSDGQEVQPMDSLSK